MIPQENIMGRIEKTKVDTIKTLLNQRKWYTRGNQLFAGQQVVKERERIAINAKKTDIGNDKIWIWVAVDLEDETVMAVHASYAKNRGTTYSFLRNIAKICSGKLPEVFVNGTGWDAWAFEKAGFRYIPVDFGSRSTAEGFLSVVDCRVRKYLEKFNMQKTPASMLWWIEGAAGFINYWNVR